MKELHLLRNKVTSFEEYPFSLPVVRNLDSLKLHPKVTFFVGENGSGKSTLLEAMAAVWGFNPEGGSRNFRFSTRESHSELDAFLRLSKSHVRPKDGFFLRAESFFNVATEIENLDAHPGGPPIINSYGYTSLHKQSHGESFFALLMHRFFGQGFYILDEPEAALSPMRQMAMLSRIHDLVEENSQFIIATHSPIIMAYPDAQIYVISDTGLTATPYEETEHYRVTKDFLNKPGKMLSILMD
ncbi:AAA family ATPase [Denitrobaculum tricleocarpae]|uniref:AAA family ATPase n=1 Tax=Denitrobaculum tricleocarpae TaxID=2591009 RepID=A0A545T5R1_9PROT|nr:AAA family ATPase [Denitrobaculum tricleocarpae]